MVRPRKKTKGRPSGKGRKAQQRGATQDAAAAAEDETRAIRRERSRTRGLRHRAIATVPTRDQLPARRLFL